MQFEKGLLGFAIVSASIMAAVLFGYVMSADIDQEEYTAYSYVTDVSTLFESTNVPEYIDYSPASNFTGYDAAKIDFTDASLTNNFPVIEYGETLHEDTYQIRRSA